MKTEEPPTAEELFKQQNPQDGTIPPWAKQLTIEHTKLWITFVLQEQAEKAVAFYINPEGEKEKIDCHVDKESITNFDLTKVK